MERRTKKESPWTSPLQKACLETVAGLMPTHMSVRSLEELEYGESARTWIEGLTDPDNPGLNGYDILAEAYVGHAILDRDVENGSLCLGENGKMMIEETAFLGEAGARFVLTLSGIERHPFNSPVS